MDDVLLDGLDFCRRVYDLFAQIRREPDGIERLRLRSTKTEKRLLEELIPLARLLQARYRDRRTREIESVPHVYCNDERSSDLAGQIVDRLKDKSAKNYPPGTVLVVNCESDGLLLEAEWNDGISRVRSAREHVRFAEVFCVEVSRGYSATLYGE